MKRSLNPMLSIAVLMAMADSAAAPRSDLHYSLTDTRHAGPPTAKTDMYISDGNIGTIGGGGSSSATTMSIDYSIARVGCIDCKPLGLANTAGAAGLGIASS